jgi:ribosome-associated translation inhibitor RaiA
MQILVRSDNHIHSSADLTARIEGVVASTLDRFEDRITRVEVHVSDLNSVKVGERDKRCVMEAHVGGLRPIAVTHEASILTEAIHGAADKLERALASTLGRLQQTANKSPPEDQIATVDQLDALERVEAERSEAAHRAERAEARRR